jgi:hypothetical protein
MSFSRAVTVFSGVSVFDGGKQPDLSQHRSPRFENRRAEKLRGFVDSGIAE